MKLKDIFCITLIIDCSVMSYIQAFIFTERFNSTFPLDKVIIEIIIYNFLYIIPRLWFVLCDIHFEKLKKSNKRFIFLLRNSKQITNSVPWLLCIILFIISINILLGIVNVSKGNQKTINELAKYYQINIEKK